MTSLEKVLAVALVIVLIICVVLGVQKSNIELEIGAVELKENELSQEIILGYDNQIETLNKFITTLQAENDSFRYAKTKIRTVTITEIDSIILLPFDGKTVFWTAEVTSLDSTRTRYLSRD